MKKGRSLTALMLVVALVVSCFVISTCSAVAETTSLSVTSGDTIYLGHYEQDNKAEDGDEPIEWIVLKVEGDSALLMSTYVLDCQPYNTKKEDSTWEQSTIRTWLNHDFLNSAFTTDEAALIQSTTVVNGKSSQPVQDKWEGNPGKDTTDKIFLLSYSEVKTLLDSTRVLGTDYANSQGARAGIFASESNWYTRSVGKKQNEATYMHDSFDPQSTGVDSKMGIRPVMWISLTANWSDFPFNKCLESITLAENGDYTAAYAITDSLGNYNNCTAVSAQYRYNYAKDTMENGDYTSAIALFRDYYNYATEHSIVILTEYNESVPECYYQLGMQYEAAGDYKNALSTFSEINQYKDAMEQIIFCFDKTHTQYRWMTYNNGSVVNAGTNGYSESKSIAGSDPHFGWSLGRFLMSGYTEVDETGNYPIFVKTPGDSLVLWFDLDQDINALNNNTNLNIAEDADGYDQALGFQKTNLGRGALLMKHTDFRNNDGAPLSYLDYLSAKESGVANTRVEINEEGIYEVALDYEIHDEDLTHVFNKTNNYRITFKFGVKNGSVMFYMFDLGTGAELEDYSRTSEGFKLDLANSHSLKIDVVRYALNQNGNGLDERSNAPASDGDEFDRTGYYVITIENSETGEKTTKHIFVGSKGDLYEYQDADSSLSKFSN